MITVGDTLICVNNNSLMPDLLSCPLKLKGEYKAMAIRQCPCGVVYVDIGLSISAQKYDIVCDTCTRRFNDGIWWFDANRFQKKPDVRQEIAIANEVLKYCPN